MSPEVEAAIVAGGVGVLTVIAALYGTRKTSQDTRDGLGKQLTEQREQLDRTLKEQREQLDKTLAEQRTRTLNERFATAASQLGSDKPPAVRLAGVYAMVGLADDWPENRQTCVDVLCGYLRMPYEPDPGEETPPSTRLTFRASREVRHTVIRVITAHLNKDSAVSWQGLNFDFTGVVFDGGSFRGAKFCGGIVDFGSAQFFGGAVSFRGAQFSGGGVSFRGAEFSGSTVDFGGAEFSGSTVSFDAEFSGGMVSFRLAQFSNGMISFRNAEFSGGAVDFGGTQFAHASVDFYSARFSGGAVSFSGARFSGRTISFVLWQDDQLRRR